MKRFLSRIAVLLLLSCPAWGQPMTRSQYIEQYADIAVREMKTTRIQKTVFGILLVLAMLAGSFSVSLAEEFSIRNGTPAIRQSAPR